MPTVAEKITIPSPPSEVWPLLSDPALVASCIPGATLSPDRDGDTWKGGIRVKFGPTVAVFKGEATLAYDHDRMRCTIDGRGIDGRGASRALAHGVVWASGTDQTELSVEGDYTVTGPLETFANAGGVHVARAILAEFAKNMGALVAERQGRGQIASPSGADHTQGGDRVSDPVSTGPGPQQRYQTPGSSTAEHHRDLGRVSDTVSPAPRPTPAPAAELNAFAILWAALKSWVQSTFRKRN